jgi:hypothetical protein
VGHGQVLRHPLSKAWRWEEGVDCDPEGAVQHVCDDPLEYGTLCRLDAGVRVYLNKLHLEVLVQHEVISKDFEAVRALIGVYVLIDSTERVSHDTFDLRPEDVPLEVDSQLGICVV